jgi:hypothetical protein
MDALEWSELAKRSKAIILYGENWYLIDAVYVVSTSQQSSDAYFYLFVRNRVFLFT